MFWKLEALTAKRTPITKIMDGTYEDVKADVELNDLVVLSIVPDYVSYVKSLFQSRKLSSSVLAVFFNDFADMQKSGMSMHESIVNLGETTANVMLKEALRKQIIYLNDGRSLQEAFEYTKIFPKIVTSTISAAEKSGSIVELLEILAKYFSFKNENRKKIIKSLIYPTVIICMLSGLSVFISVTLVPQLKLLLHSSNLSAIILIGYASFIKDYWWLVILGLIGGIFFVKYLWENNRDKLMETIFKIPVVGNLIKNLEFSNIFLNLYVYQRSGVNIIQTLSNIHQANQTYIADKLIVIKERISNGSSLGDAFTQDKFFPAFVCQNVTKGQVSGNVPKYFEIIYKYYDMKAKESINAMISLVEPLLMIITAMFLMMIVSAFILPIYTNMNQMGSGVFK
jgi:type II secretory pathway component PulF